jgi:hypothetical protein
MSEFDEWITLDERMPEDRQRCLYWDKQADAVHLGTWYKDESVFVDEAVFMGGSMNTYPESVLAWRPLPDRPMSTDDYLRSQGFDPDEIAKETTELVERAFKIRAYGEIVMGLIHDDMTAAREWLTVVSKDDLSRLIAILNLPESDIP